MLMTDAYAHLKLQVENMKAQVDNLRYERGQIDARIEQLQESYRNIEHAIDMQIKADEEKNT